MRWCPKVKLTLQNANEIQHILQEIPEFAGQTYSVSLLKGGLTNRNYKIDAGSATYVVRIAGEQTSLLGIDRACEYACAKAAAAVGIGPEVIAFLPEHKCLVTRFLDGHVLAATDSRRPEVMERMVGALRSYHESGAGQGIFSPFLAVRNNYAHALKHGVVFPPELSEALSLVAVLEQELQTDEPKSPCHNDLLPSNFIDDGQKMHVIDWEFGGMGDRYFDLGNLAANHLYEDEQERQLLTLYFGAATPDSIRRLRSMRLLSDMRECTWGFLETKISTLDCDYSEYARDYLQRFLVGYKQLISDSGTLIDR
jgi:thiamine kinase-like enzyme